MSYSWVFRKFLSQKSAYALANSLRISEKAVYAWSMEEDSPFHRRDPISRAVEILDVINRFYPDLLFEVLTDIANRYKFKLEALPKDEDCPVSKLLKELVDVPEELLKALEDGELTDEEITRILKEIDEAEAILNKKKAWLKWRLEQSKPLKAISTPHGTLGRR
jgi:hypothetical protein